MHFLKKLQQEIAETYISSAKNPEYQTRRLQPNTYGNKPIEPSKGNFSKADYVEAAKAICRVRQELLVQMSAFKDRAPIELHDDNFDEYDSILSQFVNYQQMLMRTVVEFTGPGIYSRVKDNSGYSPSTNESLYKNIVESHVISNEHDGSWYPDNWSSPSLEEPYLVHLLQDTTHSDAREKKLASVSIETHRALYNKDPEAYLHWLTAKSKLPEQVYDLLRAAKAMEKVQVDKSKSIYNAVFKHAYEQYVKGDHEGHFNTHEQDLRNMSAEHSFIGQLLRSFGLKSQNLTEQKFHQFKQAWSAIADARNTVAEHNVSIPQQCAVKEESSLHPGL